MKLDELKKSMSTLEQALAETTPGMEANVSTAVSAQTKILKKFRRASIACLILAVVFAAIAMGGVSPEKLPLPIKIYLSSFLALGAIWYGYLYQRLKGIHIATLAPNKLFAETSTIRLLTISGEVFFGLCLVVLLALLLPHEWVHSPIGFWATMGCLVIGVVLALFHYIPQYRKLFGDLHSI